MRKRTEDITLELTFADLERMVADRHAVVGELRVSPTTLRGKTLIVFGLQVVLDTERLQRCIADLP